MKLNISSEKLIRLLLSTNPTLARYKGSIVAARMLLNTLGIKSIILTNKQSLVMKYAISGLPNDYSIEDLTNVILNICYNYGTYVKPFQPQNNEVLSIRNDENSNYNGFNYPLSQCVSYKSDTSVELVLRPFNTLSIKNWNNDKNVSNYNKIRTNISDIERTKYVVKAQTDFMNIMNIHLQEFFPDAKIEISEATPMTITNNTNTSTEIVCLLTNISDKNAEPIKSILSKQLQEILPINIVIMPENIIGCVTDD